MDEAAEEIAYCADMLGSCEHEDCAIIMSREIWLDAAASWTSDDARWLRVMCELIEARRELEWTRLALEDAESELSAKRLPWWRRWL